MFPELLVRSWQHWDVSSLFPCQIPYPIGFYFIVLSSSSPPHYRLNILCLWFYATFSLLCSADLFVLSLINNESPVKQLYLAFIYVLGVLYVSCYRMVLYIRHGFTKKQFYLKIARSTGTNVDINIHISFLPPKTSVLYTL